MKIGHLITGPLASFIAFLSIIWIGWFAGWSHNTWGFNKSAVLLFSFIFGWFLLFGLGALVPKLFTSVEGKTDISSFLVFGSGGGVAGGLVALLIIFSNHLPSSLHIVYLFALAIPFTLPWIIGAIILEFRHPKDQGDLSEDP